MRKFTARTVLGAGLAFGLGFAGAACGGPDVPDSTSSAFMAGDEDAHFNTAMEHRASGDFDAAEASLLMATQANPRYLAAHMALGDLYLSQGRFADARERFEEAVTLRDRSLDAHLGLARALRGLDENTTALVHAERAWALVDDFVTEDLRAETLLVLGDVLVATGSRDRALEILEMALETNSTATSVRIALARLRAENGELGAAVSLLTRVETYEDDPAVLHELGVLFYEFRLFDRAANTLQMAWDTDPTDDTLLYLAASNMRAGNQEIGIQLASELLSRRPDYVYAYTVRGEGELVRGYVDRAREDAMRVLAVEPDNYDALVLAGDVEVAANNPSSAEDRYRAALASNPDGVDAIDHLAALYYNRSQWAEYVALVEPHLERDDAEVRWREQIVDALLALGEVRRALTYKSALAATRPRDYELHRDVARLALQNPGSLDAETVLDHARRAVEFSGGSTLEYRILLVDALIASGRTDEASTQLDTAEEAWPNNPDVQERRRQLRNP